MYNIYREKILKGFISIQYDGKKIVEEFSRHLARERFYRSALVR